MTRPVSVVNASPSADTFLNLFDKVNQVIAVIGNNAVTVGTSANGDVSTGNGHVNGIFSSTTLAVGTLRGRKCSNERCSHHQHKHGVFWCAG
jgi:hypothetical protein